MKRIKLKQLLAVFTFAVISALPSALATPIFQQGFETDTSGWFDSNSSWSGNVTRQVSGTNGISAFEGNFYAQFSQTNTGPFTRFGSYSDTFSGSYFAQSAIYLNTNWSAGSGFDYAVASSRSDGSHLRDFIFHVTQDTSTGSLLVGGSNNSNFDPREDLENQNNYEVTNSGWYIFEHLFRNDTGILAVDLNLKDAMGNLLFTETRTNSADLIGTVAGGNRYGWFTNIDVDGGIAVDATLLDVVNDVPAPGSIILLGFAAMGLMLARKRKC